MKSTKRIAIIGAGGFARELAWLIRDINAESHTFDFTGYVVSDTSKLGDRDSRDQVLGDFTWISENVGKLDALAVGIGNPAARLAVTAMLLAEHPDIEWPAIIHPSVKLDHQSARIGQGVILCAGVIGTVNLTMAPFAMVNLACTIGHEAVLGRGTVMNPAVSVSGGVVLEEGVLVGVGAQILQYVHVGKNAIIGAGAVVLQNVEPGDTVVGVPAKSRNQK
jgi:sugar O-acyltransferase (sialic acid O-acetyltransferase NeuD family)